MILAKTIDFIPLVLKKLSVESSNNDDVYWKMVSNVRIVGRVKILTHTYLWYLQAIFQAQASIRRHLTLQNLVPRLYLSSGHDQTFVFQNAKWQKTNSIIQYKTFPWLFWYSGFLPVLVWVNARTPTFKFKMLWHIWGLSLEWHFQVSAQNIYFV